MKDPIQVINREYTRPENMRLMGNGSALYHPGVRRGPAPAVAPDHSAYLKQMEIVYAYLGNHYSPAASAEELTRKAGEKGWEDTHLQQILYYNLNDLCKLVDESGATAPKLLERMCDSSSGCNQKKYLGRESFVRALYEKRCLKRVAGYCKKQLTGK